MKTEKSTAMTPAASGAAMIAYEVDGVVITPETVRAYLVSGGGSVTDQEVYMFLALCRAQNLNPLIREAYLVKYGSSPATTIVGKDAMTKRAAAHPDYDGAECGIVVQTARGVVEERQGTIMAPGDTLLGGWARVHLKGRRVPAYASAAFGEYTTGKALWVSKPATMIRKVALVQALREAFPAELAQLYDASEMAVDAAPLREVPYAVAEAPAPAEQYTQVPPEPIPQEPPALICYDCGCVIAAAGGSSAERIAAVSYNKHGRALCYDCAKAAGARRDAARKADAQEAYNG